MSDEYRKLTREELNELAGEELPERAAMSLVNANIAAPINAAVALNALSDGSTAIASSPLLTTTAFCSVARASCPMVGKSSSSTTARAVPASPSGAGMGGSL